MGWRVGKANWERTGAEQLLDETLGTAADQIKALDHILNRAMGPIHSQHSLGGDFKKPLRPAAAFGRRLPEHRFHVALRFKAIESGIDGTDRYFTPGPRFNLLPHRDPICSISKAQKSQDHDLLEFPEIIAASH